MRHLFIPDCQVKSGVCTDHLKALGNYIVDKRPEVIINIGDFADMPSLSTYEKKDSKYFHDKSYRQDIDAAIAGMYDLLSPLYALQARQRANKKKIYEPKMILTLGNHEDRIGRVVKSNPILEGTVSVQDLDYEGMGWKVYPFLEVVTIDGIAYSHYFCNPDSLMTNPVGGTIENKLKLLGVSFSQGHQQCRQYGTRFDATGKEMHGLVCGSFYMHNEDYLGPQKNRHHWRGVIMKNEVQDGRYDPCFISLDYLLRKYL